MRRNDNLEELKSEKVIVEAPFSYTGSAARIWKLTKQTKNNWLKYLILIPISLLLICCAWYLVTFWYLIFGILVIPYRIIRRGQRKNIRDKLRHHELLDTIEVRNK